MATRDRRRPAPDVRVKYWFDFGFASLDRASRNAEAGDCERALEDLSFAHFSRGQAASFGEKATSTTENTRLRVLFQATDRDAKATFWRRCGKVG